MRTRTISLALTGATLLAAGAPALQERVVAAAIPFDLPAPYQGRTNRGPEQTERFSRKVKLAPDGSVAITNFSGDITVTAGSGDEVSIEAVKRGRGDPQLPNVRIEVSEQPGRVDIATRLGGAHERVTVDYIISIPASASIEMRTVSGDLKVSAIRGTVRAETVNGDITATGTPRLEAVKTVSGDVDLSDVGAESDLVAGSISGELRARGVRSRSLELSSVSGDITFANVACERLSMKSVSGDMEYSGTLAKGGRYMLNSHSGDVRLVLAGATGFELHADTFSGTFNSDLRGLSLEHVPEPRRRDGPPTNRAVHGRLGDASAVVTIATFSGDVTVSGQ